MLHDDRRTGDFISALTAAIQPGDVVFDIGSGSGVLLCSAVHPDQ
jgi:predicted RNA methylase